MEIKVEKGQLRWNLLLFMFFAGASLIHPIILCLDDVIFQPLIDAVKSIAEEHSGLNTYAELIVPAVFVSTLAVIPVCVCVLLQKNWPLKVKLRAILIITIYFEAVGFVIQPFVMFILMAFTMFLIVPGPVVSGLLICALILNKYHKKYDEIEYKVISKQENMLLWTTYICFGITIIFIFLIPNEISYNLINIYNPLALVITLFFAVLVPIAIFLQKEWTLFVKFINIVFTEIVFVYVSFIVNILVNMDIFGQVVTPFAPLAGCVLLRYVFINSSLNSVEDKEL